MISIIKPVGRDFPLRHARREKAPRAVFTTISAPENQNTEPLPLTHRLSFEDINVLAQAQEAMIIPAPGSQLYRPLPGDEDQISFDFSPARPSGSLLNQET